MIVLLGFVVLFVATWAITAGILEKTGFSSAERQGGGLFVAILVFAWMSAVYVRDARESHEASTAARAAGFSSALTHQAAMDQGYKTKAEMREAARQAAIGRKNKIVAEKRREEARAREKERERERKEAECRRDPMCWGKRHQLSATVKCQPHIERAARFDFEWTDGFWGSKMSHMAYLGGNTYRYSGDEIKMQNASGAWQRHRYHCDYDVAREEVEDLSVVLGRIR